jgi:lon-related putative ATP-dependent protease
VSPVTALAPSALYRRCDPTEIPFATTADGVEVTAIVGQSRAVDAVRFGVGLRHEGYNLFALGPPGVGKRALLRQELDRQAAALETPADWCYVNNFTAPNRPRSLKLPAGMGARLRTDMEDAVAELCVAMRAAFDSEAYRTHRHRLMAQGKEQQDRAFAEMQTRAKERHVAVLRTEGGIVLTPIRDEAPLDDEEFQRLPGDAQQTLRAALEAVSGELQAMFEQFHEWSHEQHAAMKALDNDTAALVARRVVDGLRGRYQDQRAVLEHFDELEKDVIAEADDFAQAGADGGQTKLHHAFHLRRGDEPSFRRYEINVLVDNGGRRGAPVIYEDTPSYSNLIGRVEHVSQQGALVTDFTLIKPGALHRAGGGYLVLDALRILQHPFAWEALKRAVQAGEIRLKAPGEIAELVPTLSLDADPIPIYNTKIVLLGDRFLYQLLSNLDADFGELFKVVVDFEDSMPRRPDSELLYASLLGTLVRREQLRAFDRTAVARVVEHASRLVEDAERLSVHMRPIVDLLREADFWAGSAGRAVVSAADVQAAIDAQAQRCGRVRDRLLEATQRDQILVDTAGAQIGQVNALTVVQLAEFAFGRPTRITARVRAGEGTVLDIEREVELGGPIHSKGVLILAGFLGARYASRLPLSLSASLVFEQSYGAVEGDSASLAELCALLSALAEVPLLQTLALTGSVNQHGRVQAIGGVNEKIEGFFDLCRARGLSGSQGVLIPKSNVKSLMLRRDVINAVAVGQFRIYPIAEVDEAIELLCGRPAGARGADGSFTPNSVNDLVEARLASFAEISRRFDSKDAGAR